MELLDAYKLLKSVYTLERKEREHFRMIAEEIKKRPSRYLTEMLNESKRNLHHYKHRAKEYENHFFYRHQLPRI